MADVDFKAIWERVKANHDALENCKRHRFIDQRTPDQLRSAFQGRIICQTCKGELDLLDARTYVLGYMAAGGDPNDVWPGWNRPPTSLNSN